MANIEVNFKILEFLLTAPEFVHLAFVLGNSFSTEFFYSYLIIDENNNACVIDPSESKPVIDLVERVAH